MSKTAFVFPGQGSQSVGMGREVAAASPRARAIFDRAGEILGFDLAGACFEGPAERLEQTDVQQPAIFTVSVALWEAIQECAGRPLAFSHAAGLSLGEYTALHVAGAIGFEEALRLVHLRGQLMQRAAVSSPSGMVSLIGATEESARALCAAAGEGDVLAPANFNCPGQVVISGTKAACERALKAAEAFNCRAMALPVAGAFHSPLMAPAADGLWPTLDAAAFVRPRVTVLRNVDAGYHEDAASIRESLRRQITHPVLWSRCVERMVEEGVERVVEVGPGRVLTGLMRKIDRKVQAVNVSTAESVREFVALAD